MHSHNEHIELLKSCKLKSTDTRLTILDILTHTDQLLSADELFELVNKRTNSDRATIYRTVATFQQCGIIIPVQFKDGVLRYELHHEHGHHHHAVCTECGTIEHIADEATEKMLHAMTKKLKKFSVVNDHALEFFGYCKSCKPKKSLSK